MTAGGKTIATLFEANGRFGPSFDIIRLFAAVLVLVSHSAVITGRLIPNFTHSVVSLGAVAVAVFFVLSGFVITESVKRDGRPAAFLRKRALRIYPALIVLVLLTVFVLGPLVTTLPLSAYFSGKATGLYLLNAVIPFNNALPGVFETNPQDIINGSLWTIRFEIVCYLAVALFGSLFLARPWIAIAIALGCGLAMETLLVAGHNPGTGFVMVQAYHGLTVTGYFFGGASLSLFAAKIPVGTAWIVAALAGLAAALASPAFFVLFPFVGAYLVVVLGNSRLLAFPAIRRGILAGDFSYGFYLFAFPIQQLAYLWLGPSAGFWTVTFVSLPAVLALAMLSWHFIEKPALAFKHGGNNLIPRVA
ncbi:MAG: acyltransferase [Rhizomicrobium sp.]